MFFWSLINTFKDLGRIKIGRLVVNTVLMWAAYLGSYTALAAALTAAGQPMALVDVFDLLFGRNAADLSALLPGGAMGAAAPAARILLLCWFALPLLAMWLVTLLPEKCAVPSIRPPRPPRQGRATSTCCPRPTRRTVRRF